MSAPTPTPSRLLALPGELKNRIYRLVLLEDATVAVHDTGYNRPALMNTCKQIRTDTINTYYEENKFEVQLYNFSSDAVLKCQQSLRSVNSNIGTTRAVSCTGMDYRNIYLQGSGMSWPNHIEHLQRLHRGQLRLRMFHPNDEPLESLTKGNVVRLVFANMFCLAKSLQNEPWHVVEKAILDLRAIMNASGYLFDDQE